MEELEEIEEDAGLGNGGLGRLAGRWAGLGTGQQGVLYTGSLTRISLRTPSLLSGFHGNARPGCLWLRDPL